MKRQARTHTSRGRTLPNGKAGSRSVYWLALGIVSLIGVLGAGGLLLWPTTGGKSVQQTPEDRANSVPPGEPPLDAARVLGLPAVPPETVEDLNAELLAVGRHLVESLPDEAEAHSQMAFAYLEVGQQDNAVESWKRALEKDGTFSAAYLAIGALQAERSENEAAEASLRRTLELAPDSEEAYQLLSEVLLRQGKADEAKQVAEECVRRFPADYENHFWLGQAHLELGESAEARRCHEEAVRLNPEWTQSYYSLSLVCAKLGDLESAKRYRARFAELKSIDQEADRDQTRAYDDLSARRREVVKRHILAGALELRANHQERAEAHWLRARLIDPDNTATREALVVLYEQESRPAAGIQLLDELIQIEPRNADYLLQKGRRLFDLARWNEAEETLERTLELAPDSAEANMRLTQIHLRTGTDMKAAVQYAERAVALAPSIDSLRLLAAVRAQTGDYPGAQAALKQALSIAPYDPELRQAYEQILQME